MPIDPKKIEEWRVLAEEFVRLSLKAAGTLATPQELRAYNMTGGVLAEAARHLLAEREEVALAAKREAMDDALRMLEALKRQSAAPAPVAAGMPPGAREILEGMQRSGVDAIGDCITVLRTMRERLPQRPQVPSGPIPLGS